MAGSRQARDTGGLCWSAAKLGALLSRAVLNDACLFVLCRCDKARMIEERSLESYIWVPKVPSLRY